jgi:hypothetical protein
MTAAAIRPIESGQPDEPVLVRSITDTLVTSDLMLILFGVVMVAAFAVIMAMILCDQMED